MLKIFYKGTDLEDTHLEAGNLKHKHLLSMLDIRVSFKEIKESFEKFKIIPLRHLKGDDLVVGGIFRYFSDVLEKNTQYRPAGDTINPDFFQNPNVIGYFGSDGFFSFLDEKKIRYSSIREEGLSILNLSDEFNERLYNRSLGTPFKTFPALIAARPLLEKVLKPGGSIGTSQRNPIIIEETATLKVGSVGFIDDSEKSMVIAVSHKEFIVVKEIFNNFKLTFDKPNSETIKMFNSFLQKIHPDEKLNSYVQVPEIKSVSFYPIYENNWYFLPHSVQFSDFEGFQVVSGFKLSLIDWNIIGNKNKFFASKAVCVYLIFQFKNNAISRIEISSYIFQDTDVRLKFQVYGTILFVNLFLKFSDSFI